MDGIILVNKEKGYTSRDVVNVISKVLNTKKVGHFGTLDPMAEGLLVIGVGSYTKLGKFFTDDTKEYIATVLIGTSTDTYDTDGNVLKKVSNFNIDKNTIEIVLNKFKKTYFQEVPIYSATKVNGKRLYEYARNDLKVELPKKEVTIYDISLIDFKDNHFTFKCKVSKGTYVRSLINDISNELNIPLCMSALVRTKQDKFSLKNASVLEDIKNGSYELLNIRDILDIDVIEIPLELEKRVLNGSKIDRISSKMVLFTKDGKDIVLYAPYKDEMKPVLTFKK
jgi:tRNA pseudouridine55 synthase